MLKILVTFSVLSLFSGNATATHDQGETIRTNSPKKSIRELYDETVTFFLSNPNLAEKLASKDHSSTSSMQEQQILKIAKDMKLISMIREMHKVKKQPNRDCYAYKEDSSQTELSQIQIKLD